MPSLKVIVLSMLLLVTATCGMYTQQRVEQTIKAHHARMQF